MKVRKAVIPADARRAPPRGFPLILNTPTEFSP